MPHFDFDLLKTFVAIAETGSITAAGMRVNRTQSAISMQIKRIEEIAEGLVLIRNGRGVALTARGDRLLSHARLLLRAEESALLDVTGSSLKGTLKLGCPEDYCISFLPSILRAVTAKHPDLSLQVVGASTPQLERWIATDRLDLAVVSVPASTQPEQIVRGESFVWIASEDWKFPSSTPLQIALSGPDTLDHQGTISALTAAKINFRVAYQSVSKDVRLAIVKSGIAVGVSTKEAVPPDLRIVEADGALPVLPSIGICVRSRLQKADSLVVEKVKEIVVQVLKQES